MVDSLHIHEETSCLLNMPISPHLYYLMLLSLHQKGSNNNDILDRLSIVDKYVQIAINKLHLLN